MQMKIILTFSLHCFIKLFNEIVSLLLCTIYFVDIGTYDREGPLLVREDEDMDEPKFPHFPRPDL